MSSEIVKATKFKLGDYVVAPGMIILRIDAVIPGSMPIYALGGYSNKFKTNGVSQEKDIQWVSEYMMDKMGFVKTTPDFEKWKNIAVGDIVLIPDGSDEGVNIDDRRLEQYHVLARVGDSVLFSQTPKSRKQHQKDEEIEQQLNELVDELESHLDEIPGLQVSAKIIKTGLHKSTYEKQLEEMIVGSNAYKVPGYWFTVDELAMMDWKLLKE